MGAALKQLIDGLERRATWRTAALAFGVILLSNLAMKGYLSPNIQARQPEALKDGFLVMIDLEPLLSFEEIYRIFDLYTPDILGLVRLVYALDFVTPLAFAFLCLSLIGKLLRYLGVKAGGWRACLLLPFVGLLFDYTENALALFLIHQYQDGQVFPTLARVASIATASKFVGLGLTGLATVALLLWAAAKLIASKAGPPPRTSG
jgi:hypothetical protein